MKVAIVAGGHGKYRAPLGDPVWECWGVNQTWWYFDHQALTEKFTRWFELHRLAFLQWENREDYRHVSKMQNSQIPVYVQDVTEWPGARMVRAFPFAEVQALAPEFASYHACSIDWMLAYAITQQATEIALYGVEQDHTGEPFGSRACVEFWAGFAVARGIKVWSVDGSTFKLAHLCYTNTAYALDPEWAERSEERRVGKECRSRWSPYH